MSTQTEQPQEQKAPKEQTNHSWLGGIVIPGITGLISSSLAWAGLRNAIGKNAVAEKLDGEPALKNQLTKRAKKALVNAGRVIDPEATTRELINTAKGAVAGYSDEKLAFGASAAEKWGAMGWKGKSAVIGATLATAAAAFGITRWAFSSKVKEDRKEQDHAQGATAQR